MPTFQQFPLPDAGEGLTEAEIVEWHVAVGETVTVNQTIVEIETAKSLVELPSPWTGVVTRILVESGTTVDVGTPIIEIDTDPHGEPAALPPGAGRGAIARGHHGGEVIHAGVEPGGADEIAAARAAAGPDAAAAGAERQAVLVGYGLAEQDGPRRRRTPQDAAPAAVAAPSTVTRSAGARCRAGRRHRARRDPARAGQAARAQARPRHGRRPRLGEPDRPRRDRHP